MTEPISQEIFRHLGNLSSAPGYSATMDKTTAKALLEHEWVFCNGDRRDIKVKYLGLGVYKVYTAKHDYE